MTAPAPNPNDPFGAASAGGGGGTTNPLGNGAPNSQSTDVAPAIAGAVGKAILGGLGLKVNLINIILNSLVYGMIAAGGVYLTYKGLRLLVNEVPGAPGAASYLGGIAKAPARLVGKIGALAL